MIMFVDYFLVFVVCCDVNFSVLEFDGLLGIVLLVGIDVVFDYIDLNFVVCVVCLEFY